MTSLSPDLALFANQRPRAQTAPFLNQRPRAPTAPFLNQRSRELCRCAPHARGNGTPRPLGQQCLCQWTDLTRVPSPVSHPTSPPSRRRASLMRAATEPSVHSSKGVAPTTPCAGGRGVDDDLVRAAHAGIPVLLSSGVSIPPLSLDGGRGHSAARTQP